MSNYLVYDEFGLKEVLCINCWKAIKSRSEIRSLTDSKVIIREISKHADYREIPVILDSGKVAFIMVCDDCKFKDIEPEMISERLNDALRNQLEFEGKLPEMVEAILEEKKFHVSRKADVSEVMAVLKGT
jgi:hypothetical protein